MEHVMKEIGLECRRADLDHAQIVELLSTHTQKALAAARCRSGHALGVDALRNPEIEVRAIWRDGAPVAVGAIRRMSSDHGELKSMYVTDSARGTGLGTVLLEHLIETARRHGMTRLSLETGASGYFDPARRLYARHQFEACEAFAGLSSHPDSVFMTRSI